MAPNKIYLSKLVMAGAEILNKPVSDDDVEYIRADVIRDGSSEIQNDQPLPEDTVLFNKGVEEGRRLAEEEQADLFTIVALDAAQRAKEQMMDEWLKDRDGCFWDGVEEGKKAMREQMMEEAVEGEVVKDINNKLAVTAKNVNLDKFKFGDKVRIIIVKEDL